jgi:hypothetical protein
MGRSSRTMIAVVVRVGGRKEGSAVAVREGGRKEGRKDDAM